jgi:hypothetical protein
MAGLLPMKYGLSIVEDPVSGGYGGGIAILERTFYEA